ncbi:alpha/beta hydrolase [Mitsuaria sp. GD03876]|uniref:alpha/beta hydrolase n=1 Tax=Mitsuaria sp. GD03876 TaxID=2975399 RepID=UPI0024471202|nr:alpha/beta hydrolase [Mitsuaria sp. GD03876]MDH0863054.1 alpha/beta hydrolase [Mitsuaria sp. GD03876]
MLAAAAAAIACGGAQAAPADADASRQALHPCRIEGVATEVLCGSVKRPLDPARPEATSIDVHYVVVPALARNKLPDPVLLLAGGPGQSAIALTSTVMPRLSRLNYRRDLVFIDQRGTGRSAPLSCPDNSDRGLEELLKPGAKVRLLEQCRDELKRLPYGDLRFFTTTIAMQDMDAVRAALGAEKWNLVGASYGTRAALEYQRQFPDRVRRAVIDGVAPPDMVLPVSFSQDGQRALDLMFDACAKSADCNARYPALKTEWQALIKGLPRKVSFTHPLTGRAEEVTLTRDALLGLVRPPLYAPQFAAALPAALHEASQGRFDALGGLAGQLGGGSRSMRIFEGMHFSVVCAEDAPRIAASTDVPGTDFGTMDRELYTRVCAGWPRGDVPAAFYAIPPARTPVLMTSGGSDPATPERHARRVQQALGANARSVVVGAAGHGVALTLPCLRDALFRFIDAPKDADALQVDTSCAKDVPRPPAYLPPTPATIAAAASAARESDR